MRSTIGHPSRSRLFAMAWRAVAFVIALAQRSAALSSRGTVSLPSGAAYAQAPLVNTSMAENAVVAQTISERLEKGGSEAALITKDLADVREYLERTEKEVSTKVFDMESLRGFLGNGQALDEEGKRLRVNISTATAQISSITSQLQEAQALLQRRRAEHEAALAAMEATMASELKADDADIRSLEELLGQVAADETDAGAGVAVNGGTQAVEQSRVPASSPQLAAVPHDQLALSFLATASHAVPSARPPGAVLGSVSPGAPPNAILPLAKMEQYFSTPLSRPRQTVVQDTDARALRAAEAELSQLVMHNRLVEASLIKQKQYAEYCYAQVGQLRAQFESEKGELAAELNQHELLEQEKLREQQDLVAKNGRLKLRIEKARADMAKVQVQIVATRERRSSLDDAKERQVRNLTQVLKRSQTKVEAVEDELNLQMKSKAVLEDQVRTAKDDVRKLREDVLAGKMAELRRNNTQMTRDMASARESLEASQVEIASAENRIMQANMTITELKHAAEESVDEARRASQKSMAQIEDQKRSDNDATAKAIAATVQSQATMLTDCVAIWDDQHKEIQQELDKCDQVQLDLQMATAQVASLTTMVQSAKIA
mmetsp:Transcript_13897/g.37840  ORF Transcript_13897/g.37840 Transcript_13897/m.37840 type:complete len:604 (-) Transcript_13897:134-1945(-)